MISKPLSRRQSLAGFAAGAAFLPYARANAAETFHGGPVVLTVGGLVGTPSRGASDPKRDRLLDHNNLSFPKARTFSAGELLGLPQQIVTASVYGFDIEAQGPRLRDVLAAVSPEVSAKNLRLFALDGYGAGISLSEAGSQEWILAMAASGRFFAIGDFGPLFALRQLGPEEKKTEEEEAKWVHSLYYIEVAA